MEAPGNCWLKADQMMNEGEVENCMTVFSEAHNTKGQHPLSILLYDEGSTGIASLNDHSSLLRYEAWALSFDRGKSHGLWDEEAEKKDKDTDVFWDVGRGIAIFQESKDYRALSLQLWVGFRLFSGLKQQLWGFSQQQLSSNEARWTKGWECVRVCVYACVPKDVSKVQSLKILENPGEELWEVKKKSKEMRVNRWREVWTSSRLGMSKERHQDVKTWGQHFMPHLSLNLFRGATY